jgi:phage major head subunit gpT-like protein
MPALTPQFLFDFESRMQAITEREYARLTRALWWQRITKVRSTGARRDVIAWLLSTAMIKDQGEGGNKRFDDLVSTFTEIEQREAGAGLKLRRYQLEDTDGNGLELASQWSSDIGAYMAYWPQKQVVDLLKNGHIAALYTGYDGKAFFATDHPINPFRPAAGTYKNLFTDGDAAPIDDSVTADVALANLGKVFGAIKSIKMPNGEDPRFLKPVALIVPPQMFPRAVQITNAKFLAQAASSGGGGGDVEALIAALGFSMPIEADELAGYESNTTYFVAVEQLSESPLGAVIYTEREPFRINYYTGQGGVDAILNRAKELEWHCDGRNVTSPGHPYLLFKVKAS